MRGITTPVTKIRRQVFTEIARLAYEDGDYSRIEELPYTIIPERSPTTATASLRSAPSSVSGCAWQSDCRCARWTSMRRSRRE